MPDEQPSQELALQRRPSQAEITKLVGSARSNATLIRALDKVALANLHQMADFLTDLLEKGTTTEKLKAIELLLKVSEKVEDLDYRLARSASQSRPGDPVRGGGDQGNVAEVLLELVRSGKLKLPAPMPEPIEVPSEVTLMRRKRAGA
jgi:hypothetical protein